MICAPAFLVAALIVGSVPSLSVAEADTTIPAPVQAFAAVSEQSLQPGRFDPTRFDSATVVALRALFDNAVAQGLPLGPLVNNAHLGSARRASGSKIVNGVRGKIRDMLEARDALGETATDSELESGADAINQGADARMLQQIRDTRPTRGSAVMSLVVLTDLIQRGIQPGRARDAIVSLARISPSDEAISGLQVLVAKNSERGPGMAQDALDRYVRNNVPGAQKPPPSPSSPVPRPPSLPDAS